MDSAQIQRLLDAVIAIAARAGESILEVYDSDFSVELKGDRSPLTAADLAANRVITEGLKTLEPARPILSEESAQVPFEQRSAWECYWLVDPLDGTKEFVKRNGEFTVNIALIDGHNPVLGVVHVPVSGVCYAGGQGIGAFKVQNGGERRKIAVRHRPSGKLTVAGSRSHNNAITQDFIERLGEVEMIGMGSSLKICLVAEGRADVYPRFAPTSEWDTAAAHCVVEQAGGRLTDTALETLCYNTKESMLNPHFLVFGDRDVDWRLYMTDETRDSN